MSGRSAGSAVIDPPGGPEGAQRARGQGTGAIAQVALVTVLTSTPVFLPGAAQVAMRRELGWTEGHIGLVLALFWLGSLGGAWWTRRGARPVAIEATLGTTLFVTSGALAAMALVPSVGLWTGAAAGGVAYGFSQPHTNQLLVRRCAPGMQGVAFGAKQAAVPSATLVCGVAVPLLVVPHGWRSAFWTAAGLCLLYGAVLRRSYDTAAVGVPAGAERPGPRPDRRLLALSAGGLFGALVGNSLGGFLLVTLVDGGMSYVGGALMVACASALTVVVRIAAGRGSDSGRVAVHPMLALMFGTGLAGTCLLAAGGGPVAQGIGALLAYAGGWGWAGALHYAAAVGFPGRENWATAWTQMGVSLGATVGPLSFGFCYQAVGSAAWWPVSVAGGCALIAVLVAGRAHGMTSQRSAECEGEDR